EFPEGERQGAVTVIGIVNDNMPFLVDSILGELQDFGVEILLVAHPIVSVERDKAGRLTAYRGIAPAGPLAIRESLVQVHIRRIALDADRQALTGRLASLLAEVRRAVGDWRPMLDRLGAAIDEYRTTPPPVAEDEA